MYQKKFNLGPRLIILRSSLCGQCGKGISEPFFIPKKASLTGRMYWEDCVKQFLVEVHQDDGDYFSWPDLASCHYVNETQDFFNKLEIPLIPRGSKRLNCPQLRPIERFWGILKAKVYRMEDGRPRHLEC